LQLDGFQDLIDVFCIHLRILVSNMIYISDGVRIV